MMYMYVMVSLGEYGAGSLRADYCSWHLDQTPEEANIAIGNTRGAFFFAAPHTILGIQGL